MAHVLSGLFIFPFLNLLSVAHRNTVVRGGENAQKLTTSALEVKETKKKTNATETKLNPCRGPPSCWKWRRLSSNRELAPTKVSPDAHKSFPNEGQCPAIRLSEIPSLQYHAGTVTMCCCIRFANHQMLTAFPSANGWVGAGTQWETEHTAEGVDMVLTESMRGNSNNLNVQDAGGCMTMDTQYQPWMEGNKLCVGF